MEAPFRRPELGQGELFALGRWTAVEAAPASAVPGQAPPSTLLAAGKGSSGQESLQC